MNTMHLFSPPFGTQQTWTVRADDARILESFHIKCQRQIIYMSIRWQDHQALCRNVDLSVGRFSYRTSSRSSVLQQDEHALVFHWPPSTPAANYSSQSRARSRQPFTLGTGPWHLHLCRLAYAHPSPADSRELFHHAETVAQHHSVSHACRCTGLSRLDYNITLIGIPSYLSDDLYPLVDIVVRILVW